MNKKYELAVNLQQDFTVEEQKQGRNNIGAVSAADVELAILSYKDIEANTLRFAFSKMDYDPTVNGVGSRGTWKKLNAKFNNLWDWTKSGTDLSSSFDNAFNDSGNIVSLIAAGDTSSVVNMSTMFRGCSSMISIVLLDMSSVTSAGSMFQGCASLTYIPLFNTGSMTNMSYMFYGCSSLKSIPLLDTSSISNMSYAFRDCTKVESGALALYQQASVQATPPSNTTDCFKNCGKDTETGAAELAQIPASWGGTLQET